MTKRKFKIVKRENNIPVLGVCECCNREFIADPAIIGRPQDAHAFIQKQFVAHKCKRLDDTPVVAWYGNGVVFAAGPPTKQHESDRSKESGA